MRFILLTTFTASFSSIFVANGEILKHDKPNVLIIMTDEHNLRTLGCYRNLMPKDQAEIWGERNVLETPNLDRLATDGMIALSAYATTPVSAPTRSSFQTGLYAQNTGVPTNDLPMKRNLETFAEVLSKNGYATGYIGKWHLDGDGKPLWAPKDKFGWQDNRYMFNRGHWKKLEIDKNGAKVGAFNKNGEPSYAVNNADERTFTTDFLTDRTIEFIQTHKNQSFCCMLSIPDPHGPNTVRAPYDTMFKHLQFKEPFTYKEKGDHKNNFWERAEGGFSSQQMQLYFGMVKCIDDNIGKIIKFLEKEKLFDNTIIIFTADHGDLCGEHHRHNKGVPYETSARVPFILHYTEKIPHQQINNTVFSSADFKPSLLGLLGFKAQQASEGRDLSSYWLGKKIKENENITFMRSTSKLGDYENETKYKNRMAWVAAVTSRYKLIYSPNEGENPWLIDLGKDPNELKNFFNDSKYKKIKSFLSRQLLEYSKRTNDKMILNTKIKKELESQL